MKLFCLLSLWTAALFAHASKPEPQIRMTQNCLALLETVRDPAESRQLLHEALQVLTTGDTRAAEVGTLDDFKVLLLQAGTHPRSVELLHGLFQEWISQKSSTPLGQVAAQVRQTVQDPLSSPLMICLLTAPCLMAPQYPPAVLLMPPVTEMAQAGVPVMIVINQIMDREAGTWLHYLMQEMIEYADFEFIQRWLRSCVRWHERGVAADSLFSKFVVVRDNHPRIEEGFVRVFMVTRAIVGRRLTNSQQGQLSADQKNSIAQDVMRQLPTYSPAMPAFLEQNQLSASNLLPTVAEWAEIMKTTLRRAEP